MSTPVKNELGPGLIVNVGNDSSGMPYFNVYATKTATVPVASMDLDTIVKVAQRNFPKWFMRLTKKYAKKARR